MAKGGSLKYEALSNASQRQACKMFCHLYQCQTPCKPLPDSSQILTRQGKHASCSAYYYEGLLADSVPFGRAQTFTTLIKKLLSSPPSGIIMFWVLLGVISSFLFFFFCISEVVFFCGNSSAQLYNISVNKPAFRIVRRQVSIFFTLT